MGRKLAVSSLAIAATTMAMVPTPTDHVQIDKGSAALLQAGRHWAGGRAIERIHSLTVTTRSLSHTYRYRLLLPDCFRVDFLIGESTEGSNTVDGATFWQTHILSADVAERARRNVMSDELLRSLVFLLRPMGSALASITSLGTGSFDGVQGEAIAVRETSGRQTTLVFDSKDGHPIAYSQDGTILTGDQRVRTGHIVTRLLDYRTVEGAKFPFRLVDRWASSPSEPPIVEQQVENIDVNTLSSRDFKRPTSDK